MVMKDKDVAAAAAAAAVGGPWPHAVPPPPRGRLALCKSAIYKHRPATKASNISCGSRNKSSHGNGNAGPTMATCPGSHSTLKAPGLLQKSGSAFLN